MKIIITDYKGSIIVKDPAGRKTFFENRYASCIIITLSGKIRFSFNGGCVESCPANAVFLPEGLSYTNECIEDAESIVFNFYVSNPDIIPASLGEIPPEYAVEKYSRIKEAESSADTAKYAKILSLLYSLIYITSEGTTGTSGTDGILKRALEYMNANFSDAGLTIKEIASHCYISEIYLRKIFEQKKNTTPHRVLTDIRMKKAYYYMLENRPVRETALNTGYSDVYQFSRAYKRHFGYPPSKTGL